MEEMEREIPSKDDEQSGGSSVDSTDEDNTETRGEEESHMEDADVFEDSQTHLDSQRCASSPSASPNDSQPTSAVVLSEAACPRSGQEQDGRGDSGSTSKRPKPDNGDSPPADGVKEKQLRLAESCDTRAGLSSEDGFHAWG